MALILHSGLESVPTISKQLVKDNLLMEVSSETVSNEQLEEADLVILGPDITLPVRVAQAIAKKNDVIAIAIIPDNKNFDKIREDLLFAPFPGKNTTCIRNDEHVTEELKKAVLYTQQRKKFSKLNLNLNSGIERNININNTELIGKFLDQAPIAAIIVNKEKKIIAINRFARSEFMLQPLQQVSSLNHIFSESIVGQIINNLHGSRSVQEINFGAKYYELTFAEIFSERSENLDILLFTDITEKKLENQRIRSVLDALPQMAWTTNAEGEVTYFTEGWYNYTGQNFAEAMGVGYMRVIHPDDIKLLMSKWVDSVKLKTPLNHEARYRKYTGEYRWHLVRSIPVLNGTRVLYWLGVSTDIHDQKMQEQVLKEKVEARTRDLSEVNQLLERSNNDLKEFAYVASHDLKEPVRKIKLFIDRYLESENETERRNFIDKIDYTANGMLNLIEGIMSYSELSGSMKIEKINLNEILTEALKIFELEIDEKKAQIIYSDLPHIIGEKSQLLQLFSNLISNSLKYSSEHPVIRITYKNLKLEDKSYINIDFEDNGIGFEEKYAENIFVIFKRLHTKDRYPGSGIGLALAKKIMTNHKGEIRVKSIPGKGSVFSLLFPMNDN